VSKVNLLFLDAEKHGRLLRAKVRDGCVQVEDKMFLLEKSHPITLSGGMFGGTKQLYIINWNNPVPSVNYNYKGMNVKIGKMGHADPEFFKSKDFPSPEMFRKLMGMKILGNMIKSRKEFPSLILLIVGLVLGVIIPIALQMAGVVHF